MRDSVCRSAGNLPVELTSFVGRRRELKEAKRTLDAGGALPVLVAVPVLLGALTVAIRYRFRR